MDKIAELLPEAPGIGAYGQLLAFFAVWVPLIRFIVPDITLGLMAAGTLIRLFDLIWAIYQRLKDSVKWW